MPDDKKLPVSLQLVGLTAVVVFCLSTISVFNLARVLWLRHDDVASLELSNQIEVFAPIVLYLVVCGASLFTFITLLFRTASNAALICIAYLVLLLLFLSVQVVSLVLTYFELPIPPQTFAVWLGVKVLYAAWLIGLLIKVWPNYSVKRTAAERLR